MLVREEELRLSPATQRAYEAAEGGGITIAGGTGRSDWMEVTDDLQRRVVREYLAGGGGGGEGMRKKKEDDGEEEGEGPAAAAVAAGEGGGRLAAVASAAASSSWSRHGGVKEELLLRALRSATDWYPSLRSIPLYVRYNRARAGDLSVGDAVPDVAVTRMDGAKTSLIAHLTTTRTRRRRRTLIIAGSIS